MAPFTGERAFLELHSLNAAVLQIFLDAFAQASPTTCDILLLDRVTPAQRLCWQGNAHGVWLPPDRPEFTGLNESGVR
jgi:hypothetical protein